MQRSVDASSSPSPDLLESARGGASWIVVLGGLVLAVGTVVTGQTHYDIVALVNGPPAIPASLGLFQLESGLTGLGNLLAAVGFLAVFVGFALALRGPSKAPRRLSPRGFVSSILGGSLVAAGLVVVAVPGFFAYAPSPLGFQGYLAMDLAARVVEALGFFLGFAALAGALRS